MCGIVGYIGEKQAKNILLDGLSKLEYRGYDSAGVAILNGNRIKCIKNKGKVQGLIDREEINDLLGNIGIAHTRWATHGVPSEANSHPHLNNDNNIAVVHNGIIENYLELKEFLLNKGYIFKSQTDTEVIPNLISDYYKKEKQGEIANQSIALLKAVKLATNQIIGSYALGIICEDIPNKIIIAKKDSPLIIGKGERGNYISSDIPAILEHTNRFYFIEDGEFSIIDNEEIKFYDNNLNEIEKEIKVIEWKNETIQKGNYEDYMLKEIFEQPKTIKATIGDKLPLNKNVKLEDLDLTKEYLESLNKIYIVACGTAMHAGLVAKSLIEHFCKISVEVDVASEFRYRDPIINKNTLTIFISQSGETADTLAALKLAKSKGAKTLAIANVLGSSITREAENCIYTCAGPEIAVASTKAYTAQITLLTILTIYMAEILGSEEQEKLEELKKELKEIPQNINLVLENIDKYKEIANNIKDNRDIFFLGRGIDYAVATEGSLKLKEITYIHSESYPSGELKHGPIALIEKDVPVIALITDEQLMEKSLSNIQEVISRGAKVILITNKRPNKDNKEKLEYIVELPKTNKYISALLSIIPLQLISYYVAKEKELDVDKPRNLAKSVTVE